MYKKKIVCKGFAWLFRLKSDKHRFIRIFVFVFCVCQKIDVQQYID